LALNAYITRTQQLLHDPTGVYYAQPDLISYINTARGQVAMEAMCVRVLPPSANPGENLTVLQQEVYPFSTVNTLIQASFPGVQGIIGVLTVAVAQGTTLKPVCQQWVWSDFQAQLRSYNIGLLNYPSIWAQYGQGAGGSIYLWPIPSGTYPMDWDCYCLPVDLVDDTTAEAIPYPWTDAIPYFAAYLAYQNAQRPADADRMMAQYDMFMKRGTGGSNQLMVPDFYGPWWR
jgi:hypothetical protein